MSTTTVTTVTRSTTVETAGAVDAEVQHGGRSYSVTLLPREWDGTLASWGQRDHWIGGEDIYSLSTEELGAIEAEVRDAAERAGLA